MQFLRQQIKHQIVLGLTAIGLAVTIAPDAIASSPRGYTKDNASSQVAARFDQREIDANQVIAIAAPVGRTNGYQLLVVEQLSNQRPCWQEEGSNPTRVDPLLLNFDFTGICGRGTDSNGYSIRAGEQDLGVQYNLRVVERGGELVLVGVPIGGDRNLPRLEIGRTRGMAEGEFSRIYLDSGWRFTRRTYQGRTLGHIYLTHDLTLAQLANQTRPDSPNRVPEPSRDRSPSPQETDPSETSNTIEFGDDPRRSSPAEDNRSSANPVSQPLPDTDNSQANTPQEQPFTAPVPSRQFPNSPLPAFRNDS
ncbi:MAG: DUF3747 domain-containing protein [Sodalinema sp.]|uniref:DUF3747 domain-containing protein n=1 Tax=Sodalinema sp. TaxID=3080550 RepID=UPI00120B635D|nr:MAG: DUF3747 domain-containing protein [Phormidium sp. SL48-SHIP]